MYIYLNSVTDRTEEQTICSLGCCFFSHAFAVTRDVRMKIRIMAILIIIVQLLLFIYIYIACENI